MATCDKCGDECDDQDLIWIDSEDFEPPEGEVLKPSAYEKYSALCGSQYKGHMPCGCYYDCLTAESKRLLAKKHKLMYK